MIGSPVVAVDDTADALVWLASWDADGLRRALDATGAPWIQLSSAGIEQLAASGVLDPDRTWTCAKGAYAEPESVAFPSTLDEDGHAYTLSVSWLPRKWLRFTGELLSIDDTRNERVVVGEAPHQIETQLQFLARVYF